jgi:potassium efflux system protein
LAHLRRQPNPALLFRLQPLWFPALVATPFVVLASTLNGYVYSAVIMMHSLLLTLWLACGLVLLHGLVWRWLTLLRQHAGYQIASNERAGESQRTQPLALRRTNLTATPRQPRTPTSTWRR